MIKTFPFILLLLAYPVKNFISLSESVGNIDAGKFYFYLTLLQLAFIGFPLVHLYVKRQVLLSRNIRVSALVLYFAMYLYMGLVVLSNADVIGYAGDNQEAAIKHWMPTLIAYLSMFICGLYLRSVDTKSVQLILITCLLIMSGQALYYTDYNAFRLDFAQYVEGDITGSYLFLADSFAMTTFLAIAAFRNIHIKMAIYILALVTLFVLNSRTAFFLMLIIFPLIFWNNRSTMMRYGILGVIIGSMIAGVFSDRVVAKFEQLRTENSRMFGVVENLDDDGSAVERVRLFRNGWQAIMDNPVIGDFGGQISESQRWNDYIHSTLSYWRQFGLFVALALVLLIIGVMKTWLFTYASGYNSSSHFFLLCSIFFIASALFSRSYAFPDLHFIFGLGMMQAARLRYR